MILNASTWYEENCWGQEKKDISQKLPIQHFKKNLPIQLFKSLLSYKMTNSLKYYSQKIKVKLEYYEVVVLLAPQWHD